MSIFTVCIDGPDFSGKTTIANLLIEILREINEDKRIFFKRTNIPSDLITGSFTKILRNSSDRISSKAFALCYALDHLHHYESVIKPLRESEDDYVIILERSLLSTYIYQGIIGNVDLQWIKTINKFCETKPNLTLILKVDEEELLKRVKLEKRDFDKFESRVHIKKQIKIYYNLPEDLRKEFNVEYVDGNDNPMNVARKIGNRIQKEIERTFSF